MNPYRMSSNLSQIALLGVAVIWGWTFVLVKESVSQIEPFSFLFYRFLLALLLLLMIFSQRIKAVDKWIWFKGALIGASLFVGYWFQTWGLVHTTATNSGFITGLSVVLVPVIGALLFNMRVNRSGWIAVALSAIGLSFIMFGKSFSNPTFNLGDFLTFISSISFAMHILLIGLFTRKENYIPILVAQIGVVTLFSGLGMLTWEGFTVPISYTVWKGIGITGLLATALAFWIQNRFQPHSTALHTAVIFSGEPVFAGLFGYFILGEVLIRWQWLGAALILASMLVIQIPKSAKKITEYENHM